MRTLNTSTLTALKADHLRAILIKLDFVDNNGDPTPVYLSNTAFDIEYSGHTYLGNGQLLKVGKIQQDIDIKVASMNLLLDAVDPSFVAILLGTPQHGRNVSIDLAILDTNYSVIGSIIPLNSMIIDGAPTITDDPEKGIATISQKISSEFANWQQKGGIRTTPASLQRFAPGDTGFDFAAEAGKEYRWGSK